MTHLHKHFTNDEVKHWLKRYTEKEVDRDTICEALGIKRSRFFKLVKTYLQSPDTFSICYKRTAVKRISDAIEKNMLIALKNDKQLINNKDVTINSYNYSYIKKQLSMKYNQDISIPTIIRHAKRQGFYIYRKQKHKAHDREVVTFYPGELIQHDSSHHLWAPDGGIKWYLISSIDDHTRFIIYAQLVEQETRWMHINAVKSVVFAHGVPLKYYPDCHSIFRFVQGRDSAHREHHVFTDDVGTQWKQVLDDCNIRVSFALSPQAKGKVERSYRWLQDNLVRECANAHITEIKKAQALLQNLVDYYNYRQVHSTTHEIPAVRMERCIMQKKTLFRPFEIKKPFQTAKDIFCVRINRMVDGYRKISINNFEMRLSKAPLHDYVNVRVYRNGDGTSEVRCWHDEKLIDVRTVKDEDLKL